MKHKLAINGGKPIRTKPWPSSIHGDTFLTKTAIQTAHKVLETKRLFRYDDRQFEKTAAGKFETMLCQHFDCKYALGVNSCTSSIAIALMALDLPPGSLIACPCFTFAATPSAILLAGHEPLLIEVTKELHFDLNDLCKKYSYKMKAIVVVHMRGMGSDMPAIMKFAKEKNIPVIEDCAAACGVSLGNKKLGTYGDVGVFSTQSDKFINTGEGGFFITNNKLLFQKALVYSGAYVPCFYKHLKTKPKPKELPYNYPLYSFRIDEIRAALAYPQLNTLDKNIIKQRNVYYNVCERLSKYSEICLRQPLANNCVLGNKLLFRLPGINGKAAAKFAKALTAEGITTYAFGDPSIHNQRSFWNWRFLHNQEPLSNSYQYISECIDISLFIKLTKQDINDLVSAIDKVLSCCTN